jgi:hypothetical protein
MRRPDVWRANVRAPLSVVGSVGLRRRHGRRSGRSLPWGLATAIGRYDDANAFFALSSAFCDRAGAKFYAARTDLSWGRRLAERQARRTLKRLAIFSPRRILPQWATGTGRWSAARQTLSES